MSASTIRQRARTRQDSALTFDRLAALIGCRARADVPCPACSPWRQPAHRRLAVLRIWQIEPGFLTYKCAHCGASGYASDRRETTPEERARHARARQEAHRMQQEQAARKRDFIRILWSWREPIENSLAERYLRERRGIRGLLPDCLAFLPATAKRLAALVVPFGMPIEVEPGRLIVPPERVTGVQRIWLNPDGTKAGKPTSLGICAGSPIVLSPFTDSLGLVIAEGVEDALSAYEATGIACWAAGGCSFMPALADAVPTYTDWITIITDDDDDGRRGAALLAAELRERGFRVEPIRSAPAC
jgi:hypothetical protein